MHTVSWETDTEKRRQRHPDNHSVGVLDFSKILDKNFWSRVKLDCCQDSILCTSGYMEISGICTFGFMNFRGYEFSGL